VLEQRIENRAKAMFDAGVEEEVRRALAAPVSATARKTIGLDEVASLSREDAIAALIVRTRRYAAYQRKWLRRLEGAAIVAGDRPAGEIADEIVALARARERLHRP
jgi:tRNA A37 N6-isopentenylltransferase MiaA